MSSRQYRYLDIITVSFVVVLLLSNIVAVKPVRVFNLFQLDLDAGTLLFPISYIFGDVLVEVYGYARSRRVIWLGFGFNLFAALLFAIIVALPPSPEWQMQEAFATILGQTPRIVLGSLIAFWCGEFVNSYVMAKMKILTGGQYLWTRTISSTMVGQAVDTVLFQTIAFAGVWETPLLLRVILWNYTAKVLYEALATPLTYAVVGFLKRAEQEDYYDYDTDFNPFTLRA
ncbi:MAG: queuosine precursor transporter [Chthonomonadetes bacterium]|nr:queuosine precursor transporter [Chthonomonadetes bacterium]